MSKIKTFWLWFENNQEEIFHNIMNEMDKWVPLINEKLLEIDENLAFEISEILSDNKREFIISADGIESAFKTVFDLFDNAPMLDDWIFVALRQREYVDEHAVEIDGLTLAYNEIQYLSEIQDGKLDMDVYINHFVEKDNRYIHCFFLLLDSLIGEYDAVTKVGNITFQKTDDRINTKPFIALRDEIDKLE